MLSSVSLDVREGPLAGRIGELESSIGSIATLGFGFLGGDDGREGLSTMEAARLCGGSNAGRSSESLDTRRLLDGLFPST
jgi:hypothetical protein